MVAVADLHIIEEQTVGPGGGPSSACISSFHIYSYITDFNLV